MFGIVDHVWDCCVLAFGTLLPVILVSVLCRASFRAPRSAQLFSHSSSRRLIPDRRLRTRDSWVWLLGVSLSTSHVSFSSLRNNLWGSMAGSYFPPFYAHDSLFQLVDHVQEIVGLVFGGIVVSHVSFSSLRDELLGSSASSAVPAHAHNGLFRLVNCARGTVILACGGIPASHCTARLFSAKTITCCLMSCVQAITHLARSH